MHGRRCWGSGGAGESTEGVTWGRYWGYLAAISVLDKHIINSNMLPVNFDGVHAVDAPVEAVKNQVGRLESSGSRQTVGQKIDHPKGRRVILIRSISKSLLVTERTINVKFVRLIASSPISKQISCKMLLR